MPIRPLTVTERRLLVHVAKLARRPRKGAMPVQAMAPVLRDDLPALLRLRELGLVGIAIHSFPTDEGIALARSAAMMAARGARTKRAEPIPEERPGYVVRRGPMMKIEPWRDVYVKRGSLSSPQAVHRLAEIQPRSSTILETVCGLDVPRMVSDYAYRGPGEEPWRRVKATGATCSTCRKVPR